MSLDAALARIARTAARLCVAKDALILLSDGTGLRAVAQSGQSKTRLLRSEVGEVERADAIGRSFIERRTIHVRDLRVADALESVKILDRDRPARHDSGAYVAQGGRDCVK